MTKDFEMRDFRNAFSFLRDQDIVLYGTGQYTEAVLQALPEFHFIGLMDHNKRGQICYGLPVLSEEQVRRSGCKTIILIANLSAAPSIFQRIKEFSRECGITVYYMNGRKPEERPAEINIPPNWTLSKEDLVEKAMRYDVASFDLFDTLIARKCLFPENVFAVIERRAREKGIVLDHFPSRRQEAEKALYHGPKMWYQLDDIYDWLGNVYHLDQGSVDQLKEIELSVEWEMASPREDIICCYNELRDRGKRVIITSDMYLTRSQLAPLLQKCGIESAELYLSNECGASKHIGSLYQKLQSLFPGKRILHIGDHPRCDVENAQRNGVDALLIPNSAAWAETCGLARLKASDVNLYELFAQKCFSSAFQWEPVQKKVRISSPTDIGYLFFAPLAVGYLMWLVEQLQKQRIDHLLFISRDGYLFYRLYQKIQKAYKDLPKASYFLTSRRCASVASLKTKDDARFIFENVCSSRDMRLGEMLEKAYGLRCGSDSPALNCTLGELGGSCAWEIIQQNYLEQIFAHAEAERLRYLQYIDTLRIPEGTIGMMNFVGRGVTQRCLQSIFGKKLVGFYFALEYDSAAILGDGSPAFSWYPELLSTHTGRRKLAEQMLLGETIFSAPHGAVVSFSDSGKPVYEETSKERTRFIADCHRGIQEYLDDILMLGGDMRHIHYAVDAADELFGCLCDGRFLLPAGVETGFCFEDRFMPHFGTSPG